MEFIIHFARETVFVLLILCLSKMRTQHSHLKKQFIYKYSNLHALRLSKVSPPHTYLFHNKAAQVFVQTKTLGCPI